MSLSKILMQLDDALGDVGIQRRGSSMLSSFGLFSAGVVIGAAASLLLAPKPGSELRNDIVERVNAWRADMESKMQSVASKGGRYNPPS